MNKLKSFSFSQIISIIKSVLLGIVTTLLGVVILAIVLKFVDLSSTLISWINNIIKAVSLFLVVALIRKNNNEKLFFKSIFAGVIYALLSFVIFSILNGSFNLTFSLLYDVLFSVVVAVVVSVILNVVGKR